MTGTLEQARAKVGKRFTISTKQAATEATVSRGAEKRRSILERRARSRARCTLSSSCLGGEANSFNMA